MQRNWYRILLPIAVLVSLANAYEFGALARHPEIGAICHESARREAPLSLLWMELGSAGIGVLGLDESARTHSQAQFAALSAAVQANPRAAMDLIHNQTQGFSHQRLIWTHRLSPWLWLLTLLAWWRRPRAVSLSKRR